MKKTFLLALLAGTIASADVLPQGTIGISGIDNSLPNYRDAGVGIEAGYKVLKEVDSALLGGGVVVDYTNMDGKNGAEDIDAFSMALEGNVGYKVNDKLVPYALVGYKYQDMDKYKGKGFGVGAGVTYKVRENCGFAVEAKRYDMERDRDHKSYNNDVVALKVFRNF